MAAPQVADRCGDHAQLFVPVVINSAKFRSNDVAIKATFGGAALIGPSSGAHVMMATWPVDFCKSVGTLVALDSVDYRGDPYSGVLYVFLTKRADRIQFVLGDGTCLYLMAKRLEPGGLKWVGIQDGVMRNIAAQLGALFEGLNWRRVNGGCRLMMLQIAG